MLLLAFDDICVYQAGFLPPDSPGWGTVIIDETILFVKPKNSSFPHWFSKSLIQSVLKVALPKYLDVIIRRCQMCIEHAEQ
jgi:hypothetical protein